MSRQIGTLLAACAFLASAATGFAQENPAVKELRNDIRRLTMVYCNTTDLVKTQAGNLLDAKRKEFHGRLEMIRTALSTPAKDQVSRPERRAAADDLKAIEREQASLGRPLGEVCTTQPKTEAGAAADESPVVDLQKLQQELEARMAMGTGGEFKSSGYNTGRLEDLRSRLHQGLLDELDGLRLIQRELEKQSPLDGPTYSQLLVAEKRVETAIQGGVALQPAPGSAGAAPKPTANFYPARYLRIWENTYKEKILLYDPRHNFNVGTTQLAAGAGSDLVIEVDPQMGEEIALNRLVMSAKLLHGSDAGQNKKEQDVEVYGYTEIAKDPETAASQSAVSFRTASDIQALLINFYYTTKDLMDSVYGESCSRELAGNIHADCFVPAKIDSQTVTDRFRLYKPEITAFVAFFTDAKNSTLANTLGREVFGVDPASLNNISTQFKADLDKLLGSDPSDKANETARTDLLERTKVIWSDLSFIGEEVEAERELLARNPGACDRALDAFRKNGEVPPDVVTTCYLNDVWKARVRDRLKQRLVPGTISLAQYNPQEGDTVTLRVEARESGGTVIGNPAIFIITLRYYDWLFRVSPSMLFVHRENTAGAPSAVKRVNFAPAPGVTCGIVFHSRGVSRGVYDRVDPSWYNRAMDFLAPGMGINVSFLNFDQQGFDATKGTYTNTQASSIQIGAGIVGSLFGNKLQFVYGWNLNSTKPRSYIGVGFGFIEVGKAIAGVVAGKSQP